MTPGSDAPDLPPVLEYIDYALITAGGLILVLDAIRCRRSGRRDPLRGSPIRPNRLTPVLVWVCILASFLGWTVGGQIAVWVSPAEFAGDLLKSWQSLVAANLMQVLVAATCLAVAWRTFRTGWRGFGIGRQPITSEIAYGLAGWLAALSACGLMYLATVKLFNWFMPWFIPPDHTVFTALEDPGATGLVEVVAIAGALVLAPIGEELFFRGILQTGIKKVIPPRWGSMRHRWIAISVTALLFAVMHTLTPHHIAALAVLGVILGYLYERRGSLVSPILVHMLFNGKSLLWHGLEQWYALPTQPAG